MEHRAKRSLAPEKSDLLRQIPSVDELLRQPRMAKLAGRIPRELLVEVAREVLASVRAEITGEKGVSVIPIIPADLEDVIAREVERILSRTLQPVINATGAILLVLAALAANGDVIVSRGELIEIGDGFRIPEVMTQSGAILREVGTTNRTRLRDYENAINENTRVLLRVHPSNFKITGFAEKPSLAELAELSERHSIPLVEDLGSGSLVDLRARGFAEPTVRHSIEAGVGLVMFSGDKLLGGPQAGIIAGKKDLVQRVRRHPLFRALRVDKLTIAALEVTLNAYLRSAWEEIPAQRMIRLTP